MMRCPDCGALYPIGSEYCAADRARLVPAEAPAEPNATIARQRTVPLAEATPSSPYLRVSAAAAPALAAAPAFGELPAGLVVGEFEIKGKIGEGGMAVVYLAVHTVIGKRAAIKVLNAQYAGDVQNVARFVQEARAVNQIGHKNIVDIFQFGRLEDGRNYLVMELLEGQSLTAHLQQRGRLPLDETLAIALPVCDALRAAHAAQIIHRDLKPDNIFLEALRQGGPHVKLLDFGIAKLGFLDAAGPTKSGTMIGTPHYMAPEQVRASPVDVRADVYSLGVVLYEMVTGQLPHDADTVYAIIAHKLNTRPAKPSRHTRLPGALEALILRCLELHADRRPASVDEVQRELLSIAQAEGIHPPTSSGSLPLPPSPVRRPLRARWPILASVLVTLAGLGAWTALHPRPPARVVLPAPAPSPEPAPAPAVPRAPDPPPATGALEVRTTVARARFSLDGQVVGDGSGTLRLEGVGPGTHQVRIEASARLPRSTTIVVQAGKRATTFVELEPRRAPSAKKSPSHRSEGRDLPDPFAN